MAWVLTFFAAVMAAAPAFLTPLMVARTFGSDVWLLTWNEMAFGVGMMVGGIAVATFSGKIVRQGVLMVVAGVLLGVCSVGLGLSPNLAVFNTCMGLIGVLLPAMFTPSTTLLQNHTEPAFLGRVFGLVALTQTLAMPLGMVIFGPLADTVKIETLLVVSGVLMSLFVVAVALLPTGREVWRERTQAAAAPSETPAE